MAGLRRHHQHDPSFVLLMLAVHGLLEHTEHRSVWLTLNREFRDCEQDC